MIKWGFANRSDTESADREKASCNFNGCQTEHGVHAENCKGSREGDGTEISLQEIIPVSGHDVSRLVRNNLWPLSITKVLWSRMQPSFEFYNAIFMKFLRAGLSPWLQNLVGSRYGASASFDMIYIQYNLKLKQHQLTNIPTPQSTTIQKCQPHTDAVERSVGRQMILQWGRMIKLGQIIYQLLRMSRLNSVREHYQQLRNHAYNNEMKKVSYKDIGKYKDEAQKEVDRMTQANTFENLQQVDFYRDKFALLESSMATASKNKMSMKDFTLQAQQILKQKGFESRNSYLSQAPVDPKLTSQPQSQNKVLQSFFDEKRSKVVPEVGFRSLLQNPPVSSKTFKKRIGNNNEEISRLKYQNQQLRSKLQSSKLGLGNGGNLEAEIRRQQERIIFLESQNDRLSRDNTKLKSQRSVTVYSGQNYDDYLYSPYVITPRENDLMKIGLRTSDYDFSNNQYPNNQVHYENEAYGNLPSFNSKSQSMFKVANKETMSEMGDYEGNKQRYSIFDMSKSHYSDAGGSDNNYVSNGSSGIQDSRTANKNKLAFFRSSGLIVRDNDIQIAFKRSQNANLDSNRIILYFNNKLNQTRKIRVNYEWESQYYELAVTEKIQEIGPLKQEREVVEVRLKNNQDLNSITEANVDVDGKRYKLWLPAMFIRFQRPRQGMTQSKDAAKKVVYPCKMFSSEIEAEKVIQKMQIEARGESCVWGESPVYSGPIKMSWKHGNRLEVTTSSRWIDFITFMMFDYR